MSLVTIQKKVIKLLGVDEVSEAVNYYQEAGYANIDFDSTEGWEKALKYAKFLAKKPSKKVEVTVVVPSYRKSLSGRRIKI